MAKTAKKPKLTEEDKQQLEECFRQIRDQKLRQWYEEAHNADAQTKAIAQARLQLQIWLREKRREIKARKQERDQRKADGDTDGSALARIKMKHAQCAMAMQVKMAVDGIPATTAEKARKIWMEHKRDLDEMLSDFDLDKRTEFGVTRDSAPLLLTVGEQEGITLVEEKSEDIPADLKNLEPESPDAQEIFQHIMESDRLGESATDPIAIWAQHALHMQDRFRIASIPDFAVETKLAFQKKLFDQHVEWERQVHRAAESTAELVANMPCTLREGVSTAWNGVLVTTTFSEHSLWELTSPLLWRHFEGGLSWDYPQWVPSGIMRIRTVSNSSYIYFDFGVRTFSTQRLLIPATIGNQILAIPLRCHQTSANIDVEVAFLTHGFVRIYFPVVALIQPDMGCRSLPVGLVELSGIWKGPVE